jgi:phage recombination protein Bet
MTTALAKTDFTAEQLQVIESQFFPAGASVAEQQYCFSVAKELGLNPITKEIYFVPRRSKVGDRWINKVEPMVGRDGFLSIAHKSGQLAGMETTCSIREVPQLDSSGKWGIKPDLVADCVVYRKDSNKRFSGSVAYSEYVQKTSDGKPTKFWMEKPETMLKKVAESQVLRKAFNIHGVYCPEELGAGYEDGSQIISPSIDAEFSSVEPEKKKPALEHKVSRAAKTDPVQEQKQPQPPQDAPVPPVIESDPDDEESWPVGIPPESGEPVKTDSVADEMIALLTAKTIGYEIDYENGIISATSNAFNNKELLKQNGFRWNPDSKSWVFLFEP